MTEDQLAHDAHEVVEHLQAAALELPFADHDDLELGRVEDELLVRVGPYRRGIVLPDSLKRRSVDAAKMVGDRLEVTFVTEEGGQHMSQGQP